MDEAQWKSQLAKEGFNEIYTQDDGPNLEYPSHTHEKPAAHVILTGEMTLVDQHGPKTIKAGERLDIPAGTTHTAKMGSLGCKYIVAE